MLGVRAILFTFVEDFENKRMSCLLCSALLSETMMFVR
jgi:hypothetical protein